ncbi:DUF3488 and transglutaminase-like domain-containing protein [Zoogloea sp.]|uniref:transglutaminase TgpA family protein n=1 Tax=Zoogloea sp. TaxID=49181 RepID=UPI0026070564|nr:DUF3488 and transglutaminase-like domain-containing protein [Zoogloea sp.]MDD3354362.1 DUF3488 and transglutaminase-like domain-containing protein [Zoogloea sp.]
MTKPSLRPDQTGWLIAAAGLSLAPHASHLPLAISALCLLLLLWRGLLNHRGAPLPSRSLLLLIVAVMASLVLLEFRHFFGKDPGIALLAGLLSLKLLETRSPRDGRAVLLLSFFMQLGQFLYQQHMGIAALALMGTLAAVGAMLALQGRPEPVGQRIRVAGTLVLQGLPLMVVLFVLFPRVPGPLWGLPADAFNRSTGLSDTMTPGDIAHLSESGAIAFRAAFQGASPPPPAERYWRGPVLSRFDGRSWHQGPTTRLSKPAYTPQGPAHSYILTLEPHNQRWLLALDFPASAPERIHTDNFQLLAREPVRERVRLALVSYPQTPVGLQERTVTLSEALTLPPTGNPRTRALGERLRTQVTRPEDIPDHLITFFRQSRLTYTLSPQALGEDDVDSFLFDTRQGFCEHFAGAFVFALRAAGVPARVVTGYQGGELNPVDGTLVVRQSDAHAWTEVWLEGRGWVRIDPTAAAAPRRLEDGLAAALGGEGRIPLLARGDLVWLKALRNQFDALNNRWNQWVLGYNQGRQQEMMAWLGLHQAGWQELAALMSGALGLVMAVLAGWILRNRHKIDPIDRSWLTFCRRLSALGFPRQSWEGPIEYTRRVSTLRADLADPVLAIGTGYALLRYGQNPADHALLHRFHQSVKRFRPR